MSEKKEKAPSKVQQALKIFQDLSAQGVKPKQIHENIAEVLGISVRSARGYVWRAQNPEKFKAMLDRYYAKKRAKAEAKKEKKAKKESKA